jgi:hypothetical protein
VDGRPIAGWKPDELRTMFEERPVGSKVTFDLLRDGKKKKAKMTLAEML